MALKHSSAPKAVRRRGSSAVSLHTKVALLTRERDDALARQAARQAGNNQVGVGRAPSGR